MMESCSEERIDRDQTTDPRARFPCREQRATVTRFLEEKVPTDWKDRSSAVLSAFISSLEDREWHSILDRMIEPVSQTHLAQVSRRIIRVVSQLLAPALKVQFQPEDEPRDYESEEPQSDFSRYSGVILRPVAEKLQKYFNISEENIVQSLGSSASQPSVRSMLGVVVKQVNEGLCVLAAQDSTETAKQKKKRKNIVHFFQKLPRKTRNKWRMLTNRGDTHSGPSETTVVSEDAEDEEGGEDASELRRRRVVIFFQTLRDRIVETCCVYEPTPWRTQGLFPI